MPSNPLNLYQQKPNRSMTVASWNIEKNGQSSSIDKQSKVSHFVDICCTSLNIDIVFLCEVHSARIDDYVDFLKSVYGDSYQVDYIAGGHSNAFVFLWRKALNVEVLHYTLKGLNRDMAIFCSDGCYCLLSHFKSGQTKLTESQLEEAASWLNTVSNGKWTISGDLNWHYGNAGALTLPAHSQTLSFWTDATQKSGNILDWVIAGYDTVVNFIDLERVVDEQNSTCFHPSVFDMTGPDHRPLIFELSWLGN
ncbi:endonuclease/exonuclease/phosphatase family protein [Saccharobesus litoralis]|uniref:Endonuclease/exonuclease/phosphatase family protein n=1 Tax=Saccharobesus litoralis TaxID=2172099 RepID=A0A2S0VMB9_9ALTE|nr:endonuclease/exonuclease/phosphatase family protein [Saccharobesus litoralis]AWB65358.1 endonuclease/exonuclease/phosphatase family protein [Saccharobesus litoralis]